MSETSIRGSNANSKTRARDLDFKPLTLKRHCTVGGSLSKVSKNIRERIINEKRNRDTLIFEKMFSLARARVRRDAIFRASRSVPKCLWINRLILMQLGRAALRGPSGRFGAIRNWS